MSTLYARAVLGLYIFAVVFTVSTTGSLSSVKKTLGRTADIEQHETCVSNCHAMYPAGVPASVWADLEAPEHKTHEERVKFLSQVYTSSTARSSLSSQTGRVMHTQAVVEDSSVLICLGAGEAYSFKQVYGTSPTFPVYDSTNSLNTNAAFDYSEITAFTTYQTANPSTTRTVYTPFTFVTAGTYVFKDYTTTTKYTVVSVLSSASSCPANVRTVGSLDSADLVLLGLTSTATTTTVDAYTIGFAIGMLLLSVLVVALVVHTFVDWKWIAIKVGKLSYRAEALRYDDLDVFGFSSKGSYPMLKDLTKGIRPVHAVVNDAAALAKAKNRKNMDSELDETEERVMVELADGVDYEGIDFQSLHRLITDGIEQMQREFRNLEDEFSSFAKVTMDDVDHLKMLLGVKMQVQLDTSKVGAPEAIYTLVSAELVARRAFSTVYTLREEDLISYQESYNQHETLLRSAIAELSIRIRSVTIDCSSIQPVYQAIKQLASRTQRGMRCLLQERQRRKAFASHVELVGKEIVDELLKADMSEANAHDDYWHAVLNFNAQVQEIRKTMMKREGLYLAEMEALSQEDARKLEQFQFHRSMIELVSMVENEITILLQRLATQNLIANLRKADELSEDTYVEVQNVLLDKRLRFLEKTTQGSMFRGINPDLAKAMTTMFGMIQNGLRINPKTGCFEAKSKYDMKDSFSNITDVGEVYKEWYENEWKKERKRLRREDQISRRQWCEAHGIPFEGEEISDDEAEADELADRLEKQQEDKKKRDAERQARLEAEENQKRVEEEEKARLVRVEEEKKRAAEEDLVREEEEHKNASVRQKEAMDQLMNRLQEDARLAKTSNESKTDMDDLTAEMEKKKDGIRANKFLSDEQKEAAIAVIDQNLASMLEAMRQNQKELVSMVHADDEAEQELTGEKKALADKIAAEYEAKLQAAEEELAKLRDVARKHTSSLQEDIEAKEMELKKLQENSSTDKSRLMNLKKQSELFSVLSRLDGTDDADTTAQVYEGNLQLMKAVDKEKLTLEENALLEEKKKNVELYLVAKKELEQVRAQLKQKEKQHTEELQKATAKAERLSKELTSQLEDQGVTTKVVEEEESDADFEKRLAAAVANGAEVTSVRRMRLVKRKLVKRKGGGAGSEQSQEELDAEVARLEREIDEADIMEDDGVDVKSMVASEIDAYKKKKAAEREKAKAEKLKRIEEAKMKKLKFLEEKERGEKADAIKREAGKYRQLYVELERQKVEEALLDELEAETANAVEQALVTAGVFVYNDFAKFAGKKLMEEKVVLQKQAIADKNAEDEALQKKEMKELLERTQAEQKVLAAQQEEEEKRQMLALKKKLDAKRNRSKEKLAADREQKKREAQKLLEDSQRKAEAEAVIQAVTEYLQKFPEAERPKQGKEAVEMKLQDQFAAKRRDMVAGQNAERRVFWKELMMSGGKDGGAMDVNEVQRLADEKFKQKHSEQVIVLDKEQFEYVRYVYTQIFPYADMTGPEWNPNREEEALQEFNRKRRLLLEEEKKLKEREFQEAKADADSAEKKKRMELERKIQEDEEQYRAMVKGHETKMRQAHEILVTKQQELIQAEIRAQADPNDPLKLNLLADLEDTIHRTHALMEEEEERQNSRLVKLLQVRREKQKKRRELLDKERRVEERRKRLEDQKKREQEEKVQAAAVATANPAAGKGNNNNNNKNNNSNSSSNNADASSSGGGGGGMSQEQFEAKMKLDQELRALKQKELDAASKAHEVDFGQKQAVIERLESIEMLVKQLQKEAQEYRNNFYVDEKEQAFVALNSKSSQVSAAAEVQIPHMSPRQFVLYRFAEALIKALHDHGLVLAQSSGLGMTAEQGGTREDSSSRWAENRVKTLRFCIASVLPRSVSGKRTAFPQSVFYNEYTHTLFIHEQRLQDVGEFLFILVHSLAHIHTTGTENKWDDRNPVFTAHFHRLLHVCTSQFFFARANAALHAIVGNPGTLGGGAAGAEVGAGKVLANMSPDNDGISLLSAGTGAPLLAKPSGLFDLASVDLSALLHARGMGSGKKPNDAVAAIVDEMIDLNICQSTGIQVKVDATARLQPGNALTSADTAYFSTSQMLARLDGYKAFAASSGLRAFLVNVERAAAGYGQTKEMLKLAVLGDTGASAKDISNGNAAVHGDLEALAVRAGAPVKEDEVEIEIMGCLADELNRELTAVISALFVASAKASRLRDAAKAGDAEAEGRIKEEERLIGRLSRQQQVLKGRLHRLEQNDTSVAQTANVIKDKLRIDVEAMRVSLGY